MTAAAHLCCSPSCTSAATLRCPSCVKLGVDPGSHFCSQACFRSSWSAHKPLHKEAAKKAKREEEEAVRAKLGGGAAEALSFSPNFASIKVSPNAGESADANFPRNLHNAGELFLRAGMLGHARRLQKCVAKELEVLEKGPDGKASHSLGRACVCWGCGHAGLPKNAGECDEASLLPAGACGGCGEADQTNWLVVRGEADGEASEVPWMEVKAATPSEP
ncbi:hypothetical protein TeGR_g3107 [Tetraparma gracilis]|uniref:C6H2-type domain-containing protein n=1 Tax=Tetraparma gracilis TaxID=2962635 RepID=A0ABQ6N4H8_9STRA|nr:hypothetical protein TeGR_g3107 [Tetraparma gracilis]